jgi:proline iminopeptidase
MHKRSERSMLRRRIAHLPLGGVTAVTLVASSAVLAGWLIPRGPVTTTEAILALVGALGLGFLAGWLMRSRWALLLTPAVFMLVFELARIRTNGPTVDAIQLDGLYGVIALVGGRGIDAVLMLLPLTAGVSYGAMAARRSNTPPSQQPGRQWVRRGFLSVATIAVFVLVAGLVRPATTAAIVDASGDRVPGSIAQLVDVRVGGHDQAIMLRGVSAKAPVLLFLEGGPGGTGIGRVRNSGDELEEHFVVATWDQRGTGKSYDALEPSVTLTVDRMVKDTLEVVDYLRARFQKQTVYLVGSSWGTVIGTLAVQHAPEKFSAYVGTGQMVDPFATDKLMYAEAIRDAKARGDRSAVETLRNLGPPPYDDTLDYPVAISSDPKWIRFTHGQDYSATSEYPASLFVREYSLVEQLRGMAAIAETFHVLYPQLSDTDFRVDVPSLAVPVYLVEGRHEASGRETLARTWFDQLAAPHKTWVTFQKSGHTPPYDEPGHFARLMEDVLTSTHSPAT